MTLPAQISGSLNLTKKKKYIYKSAIYNLLELQSDLLIKLIASCLYPQSSHTLVRDLTFSVTELSASSPALTRPMTATVTMEIGWG